MIDFDLQALDFKSRLPVLFQIDNTIHTTARLRFNESGYLKLDISFDSSDMNTRSIVFKANFEGEEESFESDIVSLFKYRMSITEVRLTDDINNYEGEEGIHYTNNDSARIKLFYQVFNHNGQVCDSYELEKFRSEVSSQLLFANHDEIQYMDDKGKMVKIDFIDCALKKKKKGEDNKRILKKIFEERVKERRDIGKGGEIFASFRVNTFSSHPMLKELRLDRRKYTIQLQHPLALPVFLPEVHILTKYHRKTPTKTTKTVKEGKETKESSGGLWKTIITITITITIIIIILISPFW